MTSGLVTACALGKSPKHTNSSNISSKPWVEFFILGFIWVDLSFVFRRINVSLHSPHRTLQTNKQTRRVKFVCQFQVRSHGTECGKSPTGLSRIKLENFHSALLSGGRPQTCREPGLQLSRRASFNRFVGSGQPQSNLRAVRAAVYVNQPGLNDWITCRCNNAISAGHNVRFKNVLITQNVLSAANFHQRAQGAAAAKAICKILRPATGCSKLNGGRLFGCVSHCAEFVR